MEKETILARINATISYSQETLSWFKKVEETNSNLHLYSEQVYFSEFRSRWNKILIESTEPTIKHYFHHLGLDEKDLPSVKVIESYPGSWVIVAALTMSGSIGAAYTILKGVSELPKIIDGLNELKSRLKKKFSDQVSAEISNDLNSAAKKYNLPPPPPIPVFADFTLDARPLESLTPSIMKSHKIHLNVGISRDSFTLENLGEEVIQNIRIGLFESSCPRNQWSFAESYAGTVDILTAQQTISKRIEDFRNSIGRSLELEDDLPLYIDCWIQDSYGIYLFMFYLEE